MAKVKFKDLKVNDTFTLNNTEYKKVVEKKISCCKRLNACLASDEKQMIQVTPITEVEVNDQPE
jgi:hypothetical protein